MMEPRLCSCDCGWWPPTQTEAGPADAWWKECIRHENTRRWYLRPSPASWARTFGGSQVEELIKTQIKPPSDLSIGVEYEDVRGRRHLMEPREGENFGNVIVHPTDKGSSSRAHFAEREPSLDLRPHNSRAHFAEREPPLDTRPIPSAEPSRSVDQHLPPPPSDTQQLPATSTFVDEGAVYPSGDDVQVPDSNFSRIVSNIVDQRLADLKLIAPADGSGGNRGLASPVEGRPGWQQHREWQQKKLQEQRVAQRQKIAEEKYLHRHPGRPEEEDPQLQQRTPLRKPRPFHYIPPARPSRRCEGCASSSVGRSRASEGSARRSASLGSAARAGRIAAN